MERYKKKFKEDFILLFEKSIFTEMSKIGNLPKHKDVSVYINEKGEDREDPHFHIRFADNTTFRIRLKDLSDMDEDKRNKKIDSNLMKEFKKWLLEEHKDGEITNIKFALMVWNAQEGHQQKIKYSDLKWI